MNLTQTLLSSCSWSCEGHLSLHPEHVAGKWGGKNKNTTQTWLYTDTSLYQPKGTKSHTGKNITLKYFSSASTAPTTLGFLSPSRDLCSDQSAFWHWHEWRHKRHFKEWTPVGEFLFKPHKLSLPKFLHQYGFQGKNHFNYLKRVWKKV